VQQPDFVRLAGQVAEMMSSMEGGWRSEPESGWAAAARLVRDDGLQVVLILDGRSITARGAWPYGPPPRYGPPAPQITMVATSAEYVSGHIRRRLLARHEEVFAQWRRLAAAAEAEQRRRSAVAARIAAALAPIQVGHTWTETQDAQSTTKVSRLGPGVSVRATVGPSGDAAELSVTGLTGSAAAELCAHLARLTRTSDTTGNAD